MQPATKVKLLWTIAWFSVGAALGLAVLAFLLIARGAYPPEGTGSLGHVGMVVAGLLAALLAVFCGGVVLVCASKVKAIDAARKSR